MKRFYILILFTVATISPVFASSVDVKVKGWEENIALPTYVLRSPEKSPIFDRPYSYQRARRSVYPYLLNDNMTTIKDTMTYKAVYLENEYVKICVLPELGGRIYYILDKTDGYDVVYHNHVIKPANVGMTGAWVSGGVEWNVFHHHRATSFAPVNYRLVDNPDGSKTIWIGETELRHRMSWSIGMTLSPGRSYLEIEGRLMNTTENENSFLYWSNVATAVNDNYEICFPASNEFVTFHTKNSFAHWPVTHETYNGIDLYKNNLDASWWKNHFYSNSMFAWDKKEDFVGGYDHGLEAGTMITGNHNILKGAKFWLWGPNSEWDSKILTDNDGHYIELMVGAYSDNQPDYSWIAPYEVKEFSHEIYGVRSIGGIKVGNRDFAMNLDFEGADKAKIGINATSAFKNLKVSLLDKGSEIYSKKIDISPDQPYVETVKLPKGYVKTDVTLNLLDAEEHILLTYTPVEHDPDATLPQIVERPKRPKDIDNTEECYLVGLRNLQFHNPFVDPTDYFLEVLRRDPGDVRANTKMGVWYRERGEFEEAKKYLRKAIERLTHDYTRPEDCEALYNLGLILKDEGRTEAAMDTLYRAAWGYTYNSSANFQLAQLYWKKGDIAMARERINESIAYNGRNVSAMNFKTTLLRHDGDKDGAEKAAAAVLALDPLNMYATYETNLLGGNMDFYGLMRDDVQSYLELALQYGNSGFKAEAKDLLSFIDNKVQSPIVKMYQGYLAHQDGDTLAARKFYEDAMNMSVDYVNPFRLETIAVLNLSKTYCPDSYKPYYYLGNLYYDKNQKKAIAEWEAAAKINPNVAMTWRNLGWAYWLGDDPDYDKAAGYYRKAVDLAPDEAMFLEEIDQVYEAKGEDVSVRHDLLKSHHKTSVKRYYPLAKEVETGTFVGDYDYTLDLLSSCYFPTREGVANFHDVYVDALLCAGKDKVDKGDLSGGIELYQKAFEYPENHQVFVVDKRTPRDAQIYWFIAQAYELNGSKSKAKEFYKKAVEADTKNTDYRYWKGLAYEKLGQTPEANELFTALKDEGDKGFVTDFVNFYGAEGTTGYNVDTINMKARYTRALGELGLGEKEAARADLKNVIETKPDNLWAVRLLKAIDK